MTLPQLDQNEAMAIFLRKGQLAKASEFSNGFQVRVVSGALWITTVGSSADVVVCAGETLELERFSLLQALSDSVMELVRPTTNLDAETSALSAKSERRLRSVGSAETGRRS